MLNPEISKVLVRSLLTVATLFLFLVAIDLLSSSFKFLGKNYVETVFSAEFHPFTALFVGILSTAIVQSSSVTTSVVVGLVSGGALSVPNAIPIIMGANIGTTVTNLIVSFGHATKRDEFRKAFGGSVIHDFFNIMTVAILLPLELATGYLAKVASLLSHFFYGMGGIEYKSPIKGGIEYVTHLLQEFIKQALPFSEKTTGIILVGLSMLLIFFCLFCLVKLLRKVMIDRIVRILNRALSKSAIFTILIGVIMTVLVQSSSVTTSLLVPLIGGGIITLEVAFPIILGANIGTTVTALLAAMVATEAGLTIAIVHLLFNVTGVLLIYPIKPIRRIPLRMARWMGERVYEKRRIAVVFVLLVFFIIPFGALMISKAWQ